MAVEIQPEPPEEIREALTRLLDAELDRSATPSAWWLEGLHEGIEDAVDYGASVATPRSNRGGKRA
jgi:hypothetical protein